MELAADPLILGDDEVDEEDADELADDADKPVSFAELACLLALDLADLDFLAGAVTVDGLSSWNEVDSRFPAAANAAIRSRSHLNLFCRRR